MSSSLPSSNSSSNATSKPNVVSDKYPLWAYVTVLKTTKDGAGGNKVWKCNYCNLEFNGSYFRVKGHLLKFAGKGVALCSKVNDECLAEMKKISEEAENKSKPSQVPLPCGAGLSPLDVGQSDMMAVQSGPAKKKRN